MKTILIAHNYSEVSVSSMSVNLAHKLCAEGYRVIYISHKPYFKIEEISTIEIGQLILMSWPTDGRPTTIRDFIWFSKIFKKYMPTVVIGHFAGSTITAIVSKILSGGRAKVLVYYHTLTSQIDIDDRRNPFLQKLLRIRKGVFYRMFCNYIICPSNLAKEDVERNFRSKTAVVVLNPMIDRLVQDSFCSSHKNIGYLGRLDSSKGILELIDSFVDFKSNVPDASLTLSFAGGGDCYNKLAAISSSRNDILCIGALQYDHIDTYLAKNYFTIIPSRIDNLPTVGLESLMNGTPILLSKSTGLAHYLIDGFGCFLFEPTRQGINEVLKRVEEERFDYAKMRKDARQVYEEQFKSEIYLKKMLELIES